MKWLLSFPDYQGIVAKLILFWPSSCIRRTSKKFIYGMKAVDKDSEKFNKYNDTEIRVREAQIFK